MYKLLTSTPKYMPHCTMRIKPVRQDPRLRPDDINQAWGTTWGRGTRTKWFPDGWIWSPLRGTVDMG